MSKSNFFKNLFQGRLDTKEGIKNPFEPVKSLKEHEDNDPEFRDAMEKIRKLRLKQKNKGRISPTGVNEVPVVKTGGKRRKKRGGHHLFKRLGVSRKATKRQIKKAYEKRKKKGKLSKRVKYAYRILSNPKSRKKYLDSYKKTKKHRRKNQRGCSRKRKR